MKKIIDISKLKLPQDGETIKETLENVARINNKIKEDPSLQENK